MAGHIRFNDDLLWMVNSLAYCNALEHAIKQCSEDDTIISDLLSFAIDLRYLDVQRYKDRKIQQSMIERVLAGARACAAEFRDSPSAHPEEVKVFERLMDLAQKSLARL